MRFRLFVLVLFVAAKSFATHNRAGYISYTCVKNPNGSYSRTYDFKIYTYTNPSSYNADRCEETLIFTNITGNGSNITVNCNRINDANVIPSLGSQGLANGEPCPQGIMLVYPFGSYGGVKVNIYEGRYTFNGPGTYVFGMIDPNLDAAVNNINTSTASGSQYVAFALLDTLYITNQLNYNNTPLVTNPPIDNACFNQQFCYNPGMQDIDNDSLVYSLIPFTTGDTTSTTTSFNTAQSSFIPPDIRVNAATGDLCWNSPWTKQKLGEYDIDMLIKEYRKNPVDGHWYLIASSIFAIQIYVVDCPPQSAMTIVATPTNACVEAGSSLQPPISVSANDASAVGGMDISASGVGLTSTNIGTNAGFSSGQGSTSATGLLSWAPSCQAVSLSPYYFTIRAFDHNQPLADAAYATAIVRVVSPGVQNLKDSIVGDSVKLTWNPPTGCATNTNNPIIEYLVYRVSNCVPYPPILCKTGVPANSAFQIIGTCTASPYYDDNNGQGLPAGNSYSYVVIAKFADGSLSMAPTAGSVCVTLHFGVPIITNVSVDTTDVTNGSIFIRWQKPVTGGLNFDTTKAAGTNGNNGPYYFSVHRLDATGTYTTVIYNSSPKTYYAQLTDPSDVSCVDTFIDTKTKSYKYKVYFYANANAYKGSSSPASSVFATGAGHDKKVVLNWVSQTPWKDTLYYVFRQNYTDNAYTLVGTTHTTTDTVYNLTNNYTCCFKIQSVGSYENPNIISPLYNFSQKICVAPIDDSPPCQPHLTVAGDCDASINKLSWTNPDHTCNINDVLKYYIYYTPREDSTLTKIDSILNVNDTTYTTSFNSASIAGCYVIVAVDSAGNRSPLNNESCTDNCPEYELPNIFTPNGDNTNDMYVPVKNRYIRSVDFVLYNRWGEVVYDNTNPALGWDGKTKQMKQMAPDGVYFYTCTVNEIHYYGIKEIKLKGFVQLIK